MAAKLEMALHNSMAAYEEVLGEFVRLRELSLSSPADTIAARGEVLQQKLADAFQKHRAVNEALAEDARGMSTPQVREWQELVRRVGAENHLLSSHLRGMMSVLADGLTRVKGGRRALRGYGRGADVKGGRFKRTF